MNTDNPSTDGQSPATERPEEIPEYQVRHLMHEGVRAVLIHQGQRYLLSITRSGKLILTK